MLIKITLSIVISVVVYLCIALVLTLLPVKRHVVDKSLNFDQLQPKRFSNGQEQSYTARDGASLFYRLFESDASLTLVLLHGSGAEGRYLTGLAQKLASSNIATVVVPDLRGHGRSVVSSSGDVDYVGQLESDLSDLNTHLKGRYPQNLLVLGGHSSGGGFAIKYAGTERAESFDAYLLLAPYLGHDAPTTRPNSGDWVQVSVRRYIGLSMLNNVGIRWFNATPVLFFNRPQEWSDALQADHYTYRMNQSLSPKGYAQSLSANRKPLMVVIGREDEALFADEYPALFEQVAPQSVVELIEDTQHLDLPDSTDAYRVIAAWLEKVRAQ